MNMMDTRNDTLTPHLILTNLFILSNLLLLCETRDHSSYT
jgi:hypothetical protein